MVWRPTPDRSSQRHLEAGTEPGSRGSNTLTTGEPPGFHSIHSIAEMQATFEYVGRTGGGQRMPADIPTSLKERTRDEWRRACDTALHNAAGKGNHKTVPIYQRRTPGAATLRVSTSEDELNVAARALAALWGTSKNPRGR